MATFATVISDNEMNVLVVGGGGREHAFTWKLMQAANIGQVFVAPGNAGTASIATNLPIAVDDFESIAEAVITYKIGLVLVGPEVPLVHGLVDFLETRFPALVLIGPHRSGAQLEGSKAFAKKFMSKHGIPTASYEEFTHDDLEHGLDYIRKQPLPIVLKADGLAAGKGVVICNTHAEALQTFEDMLRGKFGSAGDKVVVEEYLEGIEFSVFAVTDGTDFRLLPSAKDYKRIGEGDTGLNTGGMGSISPVPFVDDVLEQKVMERIIKPTIEGLHEDALRYRGFIFFGLISVHGDPYVIEYNCRMGDPETQSVLPRLDGDFLDLLLATGGAGSLQNVEFSHSDTRVATVILVSGGYPEAYEKGKDISGVDDVSGSIVFHAGTKSHEGRVQTAGGRVLAITSAGSTIKEALHKSYAEANKIHYDGKYLRSDIGFDLDTTV